MNRINFIKIAGRIFILSGLATATGYLAGKNKVDTTCSVSSACQECRQFTECKLPRAIEARQNDSSMN